MFMALRFRTASQDIASLSPSFPQAHAISASDAQLLDIKTLRYASVTMPRPLLSLLCVLPLSSYLHTPLPFRDEWAVGALRRQCNGGVPGCFLLDCRSSFFPFPSLSSLRLMPSPVYLSAFPLVLLFAWRALARWTIFLTIRCNCDTTHPSYVHTSLFLYSFQSIMIFMRFCGLLFLRIAPFLPMFSLHFYVPFFHCLSSTVCVQRLHLFLGCARTMATTYFCVWFE